MLKHTLVEDYGRDAVVFRELGDGTREFVAASGYDEVSGTWAQGYYTRSLGDAWLRVDPDARIVLSGHLTALDAAGWINAHANDPEAIMDLLDRAYDVLRPYFAD